MPQDLDTDLIDLENTEFSTVPSAESLSAYQMRCPKCQKLYSAPGEAMRTASSPLKFECLVPTCKARYTAHLHNPFSIDGVSTTEIEVPVRPTRAPIERAPLVSEMRCPKCGTRNAIAAAECKTCGIVFAKTRLDKSETETIVGEISLAGRRELADLWDKVMANYEDQERHDEFVRACFEAECLPYASHKYARILSASPTEEIARSMRKRIVALANHRLDLRSEKPAPKVRLPGLNNLVLIAGGMAMTIGILLPGFKNVASVGFAAILLALGLRFFARPQT